MEYSSNPASRSRFHMTSSVKGVLELETLPDVEIGVRFTGVKASLSDPGLVILHFSTLLMKIKDSTFLYQFVEFLPNKPFYFPTAAKSNNTSN
ncbi:hypothetical protein A4A49_14892 [Nicotiana attenuata]|uniref:Uncharacterized protein n=1 Tax=Nicotiana attenuata TaxID=49451 RepID=A0A314KWY3_NICAT|nr:hypothetical protein A4A49_14892 [Nicotiana attenuata]